MPPQPDSPFYQFQEIQLKVTASMGNATVQRLVSCSTSSQPRPGPADCPPRPSSQTNTLQMKASHTPPKPTPAAHCSLTPLYQRTQYPHASWTLPSGASWRSWRLEPLVHLESGPQGRVCAGENEAEYIGVVSGVFWGES